MNLGMSPSFQGQDFKNLKFPAKLYVDYVRVYQREGSVNTGCDPKTRPTASYINEYVLKVFPYSKYTNLFSRHITAYTNPNLTTWEQAGQTFPRNSLYDGC